MSRSQRAIGLRDRHPSNGDILADVRAGLRRTPKRLSSRYFYDARGSALFERICEQPEYYLTRAELALMEQHVRDIAAVIGREALVVEYGSGSGQKTRLLLANLEAPVAYVPVEISRAALTASVAALAPEFPHIEMLPVCADFTERFALPRPARPQRRTLVYFPGSTIGNFEIRDALALLCDMREEMGPNGAALIGVDLKKDTAVIEAAYNDAAGVTAEFTLNMLARFNRELGADFDLDGFRHRAHYNPMAGRIETHIVSRREQTVRIGGESFHFAASEAMLVEYSCKYSIEDFARLAARAGLRVERVWTDAGHRFAVHYLTRLTRAAIPAQVA
ncbi:MAG TPA: L-histidine N(alpha)-methyltransferase [Rhodanobacteraceae bacterium]|nr:L-histidine N(alpha)-methyltransferase [Rhodanobacteraceae bacterium]